MKNVKTSKVKGTVRGIVKFGASVSAGVVTEVALLAVGSAIKNPVAKVAWNVGSLFAGCGVESAAMDYIDDMYEVIDEISDKIKEKKEERKERKESKKNGKNDGSIEVEFEVKEA